MVFVQGTHFRGSNVEILELGVGNESWERPDIHGGPIGRLSQTFQRSFVAWGRKTVNRKAQPIFENRLGFFLSGARTLPITVVDLVNRNKEDVVRGR